ncbi:sarcosine oxidase [Acrasis kona]|uniref:Sarcosine oxidase n=1 Tax=Acrasis kona TaxID=1008807 RepID=A0AAW2ZKM2_9EUKA
MGSAACYHLAKPGTKVLGIEQFDIPHSKGSYGDTRIIRLAYFEHPSYVPLLRRSYENWTELEKESCEQLLVKTGGIDAGPIDGELFLGSKRSCIEHNIDYEVLNSEELSKRFPGFELPSNFHAIYQKDAGFLFAERCVVKYSEMAQKHGAVIKTHERMVEYNNLDNGHIQVITNKCTYQCKKLVLTVGAWSNKFIKFDLNGKEFEVGKPERQVIGWFEPKIPGLFHVDNKFPIFLIDTKVEHRDEEERISLYGFPVVNSEHIHYNGFKIGVYGHFNEEIDPDVRHNTMPAKRDEDLLRKYTSMYFPLATGKTNMMKECMFTNSYDEHFVIDFLPCNENIIIAGGFSGHGFKFCSVIGEILSNMVHDGTPGYDTSLFRISRFDKHK